MKVTQMPPVHAANLVANSGNTTYGVDVIRRHIVTPPLTGCLHTQNDPWDSYTIAPPGFEISNSLIANAMRNEEGLQAAVYPIYRSPTGYHFFAKYVQFLSEGLQYFENSYHIDNPISPFAIRNIWWISRPGI